VCACVERAHTGVLPRYIKLTGDKTMEKKFKVIGVINSQPIAQLVKRTYGTRAEAQAAADRLLRQKNVARALAIPCRN